MGDKLLVRAYDVEVGDCIYCRIPKAHRLENGELDDFHILVDCGSKGKAAILKEALAHVRTTMLPDLPDGKKRLDLLVVTHEHQDHITGFDPADFENIRIGSIWMSAAMNPDHIQAQSMQALCGLASLGMRAVAAQGLALDPALQDLVNVFGISNDGAMQALKVTLPQNNGIEPVYVHADVDEATLALPLEGATIRVLGPENDIDRYYLGDDPDPRIQTLTDGPQALAALTGSVALPTNIAEEDFRKLQSRMLSSAFAFAELASKVQNNSCVVFLIEWKGKRLLFVGDCEWEHSFKEGKKNGGWNVMWHKRRTQIDKPIDFLKIGHHGSINATPWNDLQDGRETEPSRILDAILPIPQRGKPTALALVSTLRKNYETIPDSALLSEIGKRVCNVRNYKTVLTDAGIDPRSIPKFDEFEKEWISNNQPWRTDLERIISGTGFVDVEIEASV